MDRRIILATAGSGKTYHISNHFSEDHNVLLISFTNANVENIRKEIRQRFNGNIPSNIFVMTFDSFVYNYLIRPLEPILSFDNIKSNGVDVFTEVVSDGRDPLYINLSTISHYMNTQRKYYVNRMSKLFIKQKNSFKKTSLNRLEKYFNAIYFDEFQDYNGNDFKVLKYIIEHININVVAVGDISQANVSPLRNDGAGSNKPFNSIQQVEDLMSLFSKNVNFDTTTLKRSRRVSKNICDMIRNKMSIDIYPISDRETKILFLDSTDKIHDVMVNKYIPKLIWNAKSRHIMGENYVNWSYSKGDTYDNSCVILTQKASDLDNWTELSLSAKNKLYVALTRTKGDLYLIKDSDYKKWKSTF